MTGARIDQWVFGIYEGDKHLPASRRTEATKELALVLLLAPLGAPHNTP